MYNKLKIAIEQTEAVKCKYVPSDGRERSRLFIDYLQCLHQPTPEYRGHPYLVEIRFTVICGPYVFPWVIVLPMERTRGRVLTLGDRRPLRSPRMMAVVPEL